MVKRSKKPIYRDCLHFVTKIHFLVLHTPVIVVYNQLEKLEAAKPAWQVCLSLLSLTGSFFALLGQFLLTLTVPFLICYLTEWLTDTVHSTFGLIGVLSHTKMDAGSSIGWCPWQWWCVVRCGVHCHPAEANNITQTDEDTKLQITFSLHSNIWESVPTALLLLSSLFC